MSKSTLMFVLAMTPAIAIAQQASSSTQVGASASATVKTPRTQTTANGNAQASSSTSATSADAPSSYSAENRAKIEATFSAARERNLPEQPIRDRIAEGQARSASEAQVVIAAQHTETRLETAQRAIVRAGRPAPTQGEVASADQAMIRGASDVQVQAVAQHTPSNRSLVVALDALTRLEAQGMTSDHAVAQIVSSQNANASDQSIGQLQAATTAQVNGAVAGPRSGANVAGSVSGAAAATTGTTAAGATAGVTGTVGAIVKKPPV